MTAKKPATLGKIAHSLNAALATNLVTYLFTETPNDSDTTANTTITQPPNDENNPEAMMESLAEYTDEEEDVELPPAKNTETPANNTLNEDRRNQTAAKQSYEQQHIIN